MGRGLGVGSDLGVGVGLGVKVAVGVAVVVLGRGTCCCCYRRSCCRNIGVAVELACRVPVQFNSPTSIDDGASPVTCNRLDEAEVGV